METTRAWYRWTSGAGEGNIVNDLSANYVTIHGTGPEALAETPEPRSGHTRRRVGGYRHMDQSMMVDGGGGHGV